MVPIKLYRMGSDPEFLFATMKEWSHTVVPASSVITNNKALGLTTFIGVDGHAATAELRPTPAYNIRRCLLDVAAGLSAVDDHIRNNKKWRDMDLKIWAQPNIKGEPLGGHIHVTMFVNDPLMAALAKDFNFMFDNQWNTYEATRPTKQPPTAMMEQFAMSLQSREAMGMQAFADTMNYLLLPLEKWVQPWPSRMSRNSKYGAQAGDPVRRMNNSPRPNMPKYKDWAYVHYEYRVPSTWLVHPWLAYAYFGLAKLTMLNFDAVYKMAGTANSKPDVNSTAEPQNGKFLQQLRDRLSAVERLPKVRRSKDLKDLQPALKYLNETREEWFNPFAPIAVNHWRTML